MFWWALGGAAAGYVLARMVRPYVIGWWARWAWHRAMGHHNNERD